MTTGEREGARRRAARLLPRSSSRRPPPLIATSARNGPWHPAGGRLGQGKVARGRISSPCHSRPLPPGTRTGRWTAAGGRGGRRRPKGPSALLHSPQSTSYHGSWVHRRLSKQAWRPVGLTAVPARSRVRTTHEEGSFPQRLTGVSVYGKPLSWSDVAETTAPWAS
jgi:hypothetical protein